MIKYIEKGAKNILNSSHLRTGFWEERFSDGSLWCGNYVDGEENGIFYSVSPKGDIAMKVLYDAYSDRSPIYRIEYYNDVVIFRCLSLKYYQHTEEI